MEEEKYQKLIEEEKKAIEKIKNRQKAEIEQIIEAQIKTEIMIKQNEEKERKIKEREALFLKAMLYKKKVLLML